LISSIKSEIFRQNEIISYLELAVDPENLLIHLNSFHRKIDLDEFLSTCSRLGVKYLLCVSGDGSPRLPRLEPADLAMNCNTVTSVELIKYIHAEYPGCFTIGAAFNHYDPLEDELDKLGRKRDAGAEFVITQPVLRGIYLSLLSFKQQWENFLPILQEFSIKR